MSIEVRGAVPPAEPMVEQRTLICCLALIAMLVTDPIKALHEEKETRSLDFESFLVAPYRVHIAVHE